MNGLSVMIPVRSFHDGKSRLASRRPAGPRAILVRQMLEAVIDAVIESGVADRVAIVSPDEAVLNFANSYRSGISGLRQPLDKPGLIAAAELSRQTALSQHTGRMLMLFGDLPTAMPDDIRLIAAESAPVVIATDWVGGGTNGLLLDLNHPGTHEFRFAYGSGSRWLHEAEANRLGIQPATVVTGGVAYDLDTAEDFKALIASARDLPDWLRALPIQLQETIA